MDTELQIRDKQKEILFVNFALKLSGRKMFGLKNPLLLYTY